MALGSILWLISFKSNMSLLVTTTVILILLGLGADFDILLWNRIKEEYIQSNNLEEAIELAIQKSTLAIRTSGMAMASAFFALLYGNLVITRQFGLVTFLGILIDVFFVRTILVPAILLVNRKGTISALTKHEN